MYLSFLYEIKKGGVNGLFERKKEKPQNEKVYTEKELRALTDSELLELCAEKNQDAFAIIVEKYEKFVYSAVWTELKNNDDAFDVSQEVFIRLWNAAGGFRCESTLKTWLYRMCKNCAYDFMRKYYKHKALSLSKNDGENEDGGIEDIPSEIYTDEEVIKKETARAVRKAIAGLPEEQRDVIVLRELEGLSYTEISEVLGINEGTVKSRISRGREALKKFLEKYK